MSLSEKQMLLLDNFMYTDIAPKYENNNLGDVLKQYTDSNGQVSEEMLKEMSVKTSGGISLNEMSDVMNQMLADNTLCSLNIEKTTTEYHGSIRGACFVDEKGNATVAFRGTGGSFDQWYGNFEAYGDVENSSQIAAAEFINSLPYENIDVTGHSNGGNLAMYVAIVCGNKIRKCLAYEGEGFSQEFCDYYADEIEQYKHNITLISASNDPIHSVLINISGITKYVHGDAIFSHGTYILLNKNKFDEDGNFTADSYAEEGMLSKIMFELTLDLAAKSNDLEAGPKVELAADIIGIVFGLCMDHKGDDTWKKAIQKLSKSLAEYEYYSSYGYKNAVLNPHIVINTATMRNHAVQLSVLSSRSKSLDRRMNSLYFHAGFDWNAVRSVATLGSLLKAEVVLDFAGRLDKCASYLNETASDFEKAEREIVGMI